MPDFLTPKRHRARHCTPPLLALLLVLGVGPEVLAAGPEILAGGPEVLAGAPETRSAEPVVVHIDNFTFGPNTITVAPGTAVTWINGDDIPHTVVAKDRIFRSKALDTEDRYTFVFTQPGEYPYFCSLHPHMTGTVVVTGPAG